MIVEYVNTIDQLLEFIKTLKKQINIICGSGELQMNLGLCCLLYKEAKTE